MTWPQLGLAAAHFVEDTGLLVGLGSFVIRRLARMPPRIRWVDPPMEGAFVLAVAGGAGVLIADPSWLVAARVVAEGIALLLCIRGVPAVAPVAVLAAVLLSPASHASDVMPPAGAELVDVLHVLSAAMWAGGIIALATQRPPAGWRSPEARMLVERFGRVAIIAFGVTSLSGLLRATEQLSSVDQLWTTAYGIALSAKVALVLVMLVLALLWRRGHAVGALDAVVAVGIVIATSLLAALSPPA